MFGFFFFFQAEDGIRDATVTGVQTCALPICANQEATGVAHPASWFAPLARSAGENGREAVLRDPCPGIGERVAVVEDREDVAIANEPGQGRGFVRRAGLREYVAAGGPAAHPVLERPVDAGDRQR